MGKQNWSIVRLGEVVTIETGQKDVNAGNPDGKYPFFTCSRKTYRINTYTHDADAILVAGNGDFSVKYFTGKFDVYQRTYVLKKKNNQVDLKFIFELLKNGLAKLTANNQGSTIKYLKMGDFVNFEIPLPSIETQHKIAAILASADAAADTTKKVIDQTERLKKGLMQQLFTRGIGHTKFKQTEIGEVPEEWDVNPLIDVVDFQEGPGILAKDFKSEGVPLIRLEGLSSDSLLRGCNYLDPFLVAKKWPHFSLRVGDVLLSSSASLGRVAIVDNESAGSVAYTGIIRFRPMGRNISQSFLKLFLMSPVFFKQIALHDTGSTIKHFGPIHLKQMWFPVPSLAEQRSIVDALSVVLDKITTNQKMLSIQERLKRGLMQDLLTGSVK